MASYIQQSASNSHTKGFSYPWITACGKLSKRGHPKLALWTSLPMTSQQYKCHKIYRAAAINTSHSSWAKLLSARTLCVITWICKKGNCWPPAYNVDVVMHLPIVNAGAGLKAAHGHLGLGAECCGDMKSSCPGSKGQLDQRKQRTILRDNTTNKALLCSFWVTKSI